ncbi:MAG TPA: cupin domain-containing protein [Halomicronema sp.]
MNSLSFLIQPYSIEKFFTENWTKKALLIPANTPNKLQHLFSWQHLNNLLNFHQLQSPDLRFSLDGKTLSNTKSDQWQNYLQQGATLILNGIHQRVPELATLAATIRQETGHRTQINLYCSPAEQKGFDCHYDTHEVLILQIDGQKEWFIFPETIPYPISGMRPSDHIPPDIIYLQCTLKPGDVLYIPRGHWHYAISCNNPQNENYSPSLHLTLGIDCQTGLDWLEWVLKKLQKTPEWRQNLPLVYDKNLPLLKQHIETLRDSLINTLQDPEFIQSYINHLTYSDLPPLPFSFPYQLGSKIFEQGLETRFISSALHPVKITKINETQTQVIVGEKQATLKGISSDLVEKLFRSEGFTLLDLAEWAPLLDIETAVIPLLTNLVTQGILFVEALPNTSEGN